MFAGAAYLGHTHAIAAIDDPDSGEGGNGSECTFREEGGGSGGGDSSGAGGEGRGGEVAGGRAPLANGAQARVRPGQRIRRPSVRLSLTFRRVAAS